MTKAADRVLYVGTDAGIYEAVPNGGGYVARLLGLEDAGPIRANPIVDARDPRRLYVGTGEEGMQRSDDGGATWHEIDKGIRYKSVWSVAQHPETGELYAGTEPSAVFKSTNGGDTWTHCQQLHKLPETRDWSWPGPPHIHHVKGMGLCAQDPQRIFGAIEEGWAIRSQDGGQTWQCIKDGVHMDGHSATYMPDDPGVIGFVSGTGFYRSEDGGDHFEKSCKGLDRRYLTPLAVHPARPRVLFVAGSELPPPWWRRPEGANTGFYRSEDQGRSWEELRGGVTEHFHAGPRAIAIDPADPDTVAVSLTDGRVWLTEDGGESFRQILSDLPSAAGLCFARR